MALKKKQHSIYRESIQLCVKVDKNKPSSPLPGTTHSASLLQFWSFCGRPDTWWSYSQLWSSHEQLSGTQTGLKKKRCYLTTAAYRSCKLDTYLSVLWCFCSKLQRQQSIPDWLQMVLSLTLTEAVLTEPMSEAAVDRLRSMTFWINTELANVFQDQIFLLALPPPTAMTEIWCSSLLWSITDFVNQWVEHRKKAVKSSLGKIRTFNRCTEQTAPAEIRTDGLHLLTNAQ